MVLDERYPSDTLFFVLEEDYRFWPEGEDPDGADGYKTRVAEVKKVVKRGTSSNKMRKAPVKEEEVAAQSPGASSASGAYRPDAKGRGKGKRIGTEYHHVPVRGSSTRGHPDEGFKQNVADLIRMATLCHRLGKGDIIWFGWCATGGKKKPSWPTQGSHGLCVTKPGALAIRMAMEEGKVKRGHIDLRLLDWLRLPGEARRAKACYLYPSVGSYFQHPLAATLKTLGKRQEEGQRDGRKRVRQRWERDLSRM